MGKFKSYCQQECTSCNSIRFISSANRYCYEDKFQLTPVASQIRYKSQNKTHIVATGVIDHKTHQGTSLQNDNESYTWEVNFNLIKHVNNDSNFYLIKETCKELKINFIDFFETLKNIKTEMETEYEY